MKPNGFCCACILMASLRDLNLPKNCSIGKIPGRTCTPAEEARPKITSAGTVFCKVSSIYYLVLCSLGFRGNYQHPFSFDNVREKGNTNLFFFPQHCYSAVLRFGTPPANQPTNQPTNTPTTNQPRATLGRAPYNQPTNTPTTIRPLLV